MCGAVKADVGLDHLFKAPFVNMCVNYISYINISALKGPPCEGVAKPFVFSFFCFVSNSMGF